VHQLDPLHVLFSLPEADAAERRRELAVIEGVPTPAGKQAVGVLLPDDTAYAQRGRVDYIAPDVDADTGTVQARALFPNPEGQLMPGQFLRVTLAGAPVENAITLPATALVEGPQGEVVYRVDEHQQAATQPVTVGQQLEDGEVIITAGLRGGEQVVVGGLAGVQPGRALAWGDASAGPEEVATTDTAQQAADAR
jgi:membrane fusion protein (multidrug efflux system)